MSEEYSNLSMEYPCNMWGQACIVQLIIFSDGIFENIEHFLIMLIIPSIDFPTIIESACVLQ